MPHSSSASWTRPGVCYQKPTGSISSRSTRNSHLERCGVCLTRLPALSKSSIRFPSSRPQRSLASFSLGPTHEFRRNNSNHQESINLCQFDLECIDLRKCLSQHQKVHPAQMGCPSFMSANPGGLPCRRKHKSSELSSLQNRVAPSRPCSRFVAARTSRLYSFQPHRFFEIESKRLTIGPPGRPCLVPNHRRKPMESFHSL